MSGIVIFVVVPAALISGWILATLIFKLARLERIQKAAPGEKTFNRLHMAVSELSDDVDDLADHQDRQMKQMEGSLESLEQRLERLSAEVRSLLLELDRLPARVADQLAVRAQIRQAASGVAGEAAPGRTSL